MGDTGARLVRFAVLVLAKSLGGICSLKLRDDKLDLFGVAGPLRSKSSFETVRSSINAGDGDSVGFVHCEDHGRDLTGDLGRGSPNAGWRNRSWLP